MPTSASATPSTTPRPSACPRRTSSGRSNAAPASWTAANLEEIVYEGYGSGGVAILCEVLTDNRNRTAGEIRKIFELSDGKLGGSGCVAWMFDNKGLFLIPRNAIDEEKLMELALEAGADDVQRTGDKFEVVCNPAIYRDVAKALADAGITPEASQITRVPKNTVDINEPEAAQKVLRLMERLDDHDDVQNVVVELQHPRRRAEGDRRGVTGEYPHRGRVFYTGGNGRQPGRAPMGQVLRESVLLAVMLLLPIGCHGEPQPPSPSQTAAAPAKSYKSVRGPAVAGLFYPLHGQDLSPDVDHMLAEVKSEPVKGLRALICPHAGYEFSGPIAAVSYKQLAGRNFSTVIILGPSHYAAFAGAFISAVDAYETPLGMVPLSPKAAELAKQAPLTSSVDCRVERPAWWHQSPKELPAFGEDAPDTWEHSLEVQLPFLQRTLKNFSIIPIIFGEVSPEQVAGKLLPFLDDTTLIIASTDLSHYHPYEEANRLDKRCVDAICGLQANRITGMDACGYQPVLTLMEIARRKGWKAKLLDYRNSGDTSGQKANVVGYAAIAFFEPPGGFRCIRCPGTTSSGRIIRGAENEFTPQERRFLLNLARKSITATVAGGEAPKEDGKVAEKFHAARACFVTLKKHGELRGCIGTILPEEPLYQAVIHYAKAAATEDPRFPPVTAEELSEINVEVSVLTVPKRLDFSSPPDLLAKLRPGIDGVVFGLGTRQATFLPQVWEQLPAKQTFLDQLCRKAGLPESAWMDPTPQCWCIRLRRSRNSRMGTAHCLP